MLLEAIFLDKIKCTMIPDINWPLEKMNLPVLEISKVISYLCTLCNYKIKPSTVDKQECSYEKQIPTKSSSCFFYVFTRY